MSKKLLKSGLIVSSMTLISRVLGLVRDIVIAQLMGAGAAADLFFFANKIPNFLRRLFAEGAFAQAFVPVLTEYEKAESPDQVKALIAAVSGTLGSTSHGHYHFRGAGLFCYHGVIWFRLVFRMVAWR